MSAYTTTRKKVFVSFDYDDDNNYKELLAAWDKNKNFDFTFEDKTPGEINSNKVRKIKEGLTRKIREATHTLVIVGEGANKQHRDHILIGYKNWINFEIAKSIENGNHLALIRLEKGFELPEECRKGKCRLYEGFTRQNITDALNNTPTN